jgi:hypothetical protein
MKRRGVTLIEAVLYISVALALIVGGLVFYQQASRAQKTNEAVRQFSALVAEARALYVNNPFQSVLTGTFPPAGSSIGAALVASGAVPSQYAVAGTIRGGTEPSTMINPWGGSTEVYGTTIAGAPYIIILTSNVPVEVCPRLIASNVDPLNPLFSTATSAIADGQFQVGVWTMASDSPTFLFRNFSMTQAAAMCPVGTQLYNLNYNLSTGAYTGPQVTRPPSVGMWMTFRLY